MDQIRPVWTEIDRNGPKLIGWTELSKMDRNGPNSPKWTKLDQNRPKETKLD